MKRNECRVWSWETEWTPEEIEAGELDAEKLDQEPYLSECPVRDLSSLLRGYQPSQSHLHTCRDLSRVWFSRTDENYRTGGCTEESIHLHHEASPREARIWAWAIRYALKRGWLL